MSPEQRTARVKQLAADFGFDRAAIAPAEPIARAAFVQQWLDRGYAGQMHYLDRADRTDPRHLLPGLRSIVVLASNYHHPPPPELPSAGPRGRVAMYAWGDDYHTVIKKKLWSLIDALRDALDEPFDARPCVDTAPIIERELAAAAGLGWIGKNTMVLHADLGSYFFLSEILTTLELAPDAPTIDRCGSCRRCLDACPTDAFVKPYVMDASRCIAYLTIELRDEIPEPLREPMGDWVFGCDVCQDVCPYNRRAPETTEPHFAPRDSTPRPPLRELVIAADEQLRPLRRKSAISRAKPAMLRRNAAIALGNTGDHTDAHRLEQAAATDPHARWAADKLRDRG